MRIRIIIAYLFAELLLTAAFGRATTLARMDLAQLVASADAIARVECAAAQSQWQSGGIWTVTTFRTVETIKGDLPARFAIVLPGGRVGHLSARVDGAPRFVPGEQAVVFFQRTQAGGFSVTGWVQGTFRILRDSQTGHETVTQDSSSFAVFDPASRSFRTEGVRAMPIEQFRKRLAAAAQRQEKTR